MTVYGCLSVSFFYLNRMQHHQLSYEQIEVWISLFHVWHHVTQYQKDNPTRPRSCHGFYQHQLCVSCSSTSCSTLRDMRSNTELCLVFVLMRAMFQEVKTLSITIYAYPIS